MSKCKKIIKLTAFVFILSLVVNAVTGILVPKNYTGEWASPVNTYSGFYELEKNTADVLFLGSSHAYSCFCPQVLYDDYGITSYNLGMGNQNLILNYYWLREALKTQAPKAVVLECIFMFPRENNPVNAPESALQKSLSYMKWSGNRIGAIRAICSEDPDQKICSYIPLVRFHDRWKELHEEDFNGNNIARLNGLKGYSAEFRDYSGYEDYKPYKSGDSGSEEFLPVMKKYLDKITELCKKEGMDLVLTLTPSAGATAERHNSLQKYADEQGVYFYDFNIEETVSEMKYDFSCDNSDIEHANVWGAKKVTDKMGEFLVDTLGMEAHEDIQWSSTEEYYENKLSDAELPHTDNICEYLEKIKSERYTVFISAMDDASADMDDEIVNAMENLGLKTDLRGHFRESYIAVIEGGKVITEQCSSDKIVYEGSARGGKTLYEITSAGNEAGSISSISVAGQELSQNRRGLNIVVIDNESCGVIDSVCFDTCDGLAATRK